MQQHHCCYPHNLCMAAGLRLLQKKLFSPTRQIDLHKGNNISDQQQIEHLHIYRRFYRCIHPFERDHHHGIQFSANRNNHCKQQKVLHLDSKRKTGLGHLYQMIRIYRKNHACHRTSHYTGQQGSDSGFGSIKTFDGFDDKQ